jgi:hypothetical protein
MVLLPVRGRFGFVTASFGLGPAQAGGEPSAFVLDVATTCFLDELGAI